VPFAKRSSALFVAVILFAACYAGSAHALQADQNVQTIEVIAKKYDFTPSPIHVKQGTRVRLKITATDRAHGIKIDEYPDGAKSKGEPGLVFTSKQDCVKLEKDVPATVEFVAKNPGTYTFKCCVHCGFGHGHLTGQIVAEP